MIPEAVASWRRRNTSFDDGAKPCAITSWSLTRSAPIVQPVGRFLETAPCGRGRCATLLPVHIPRAVIRPGETNLMRKEAIREPSLRYFGHQPGRRGAEAHSVGRPRHAGARSHPRALRRGAPARGRAHRRLHARDHRDGEPHAHARGFGRRGDAVRLQPAVHPGRHRRLARARLRRARVSPSPARTRKPTSATSPRWWPPTRRSSWTTAPIWTPPCTRSSPRSWKA